MKKALIVSVHMKPEHRDAILKGAFEDARGSQNDEPGCRRFDVVIDDADPNHMYFYEVYDDDAAFTAHTQAPHFPAWRDLPQTPDGNARRHLSKRPSLPSSHVVRRSSRACLSGR